MQRSDRVKSTPLTSWLLAVAVILIIIVRCSAADTIDQACELIASGTVTNETELIQEELLPLGQTAIDAMLYRLQEPMVSLTNGVASENNEAGPAVDVLFLFGNTGYSNLVAHISDSNACYRANVLGALARWNRSELFGIYTNALNDTSLAYPGDARAVPPRICDQAYRILWDKIESLGFSPPYRISLFDSYDETTRNSKIDDFKLWWSTNGVDVIEEFNDRYE